MPFNGLDLAQGIRCPITVFTIQAWLGRFVPINVDESDQIQYLLSFPFLKNNGGLKQNTIIYKAIGIMVGRFNFFKQNYLFFRNSYVIFRMYKTDSQSVNKSSGPGFQ